MANHTIYEPVAESQSQEDIDREIDELLLQEEDLGARGARVRDIEGQTITENDGVFSNMAAKPSTGTGKHFEEIEPPSYHEAVVDPSPDYFVNCVDEGGEVLIEGFPVGDYFTFFVNMFISMTFDVLGFFLTTMMATSHAARYGSQAGLGLTLVRYGVLLKHKADMDDDPYPPEYEDPEEEKSRRVWSSMFILLMGVFVLLRATIEFIRLRRMRSILDSIPLPYGI